MRKRRAGRCGKGRQRKKKRYRQLRYSSAHLCPSRACRGPLCWPRCCPRPLATETAVAAALLVHRRRQKMKEILRRGTKSCHCQQHYAYGHLLQWWWRSKRRSVLHFHCMQQAPGRVVETRRGGKQHFYRSSKPWQRRPTQPTRACGAPSQEGPVCCSPPQSREASETLRAQTKKPPRTSSYQRGSDRPMGARERLRKMIPQQHWRQPCPPRRNAGAGDSASDVRLLASAAPPLFRKSVAFHESSSAPTAKRSQRRAA